MTGTSPPRRIVRTELLHLLDRSEDFSLTLVLAPAGSGKSTLLRQWQAQRPDLRTVLVALDPGDADPVRFFRRLGEALRQVLPDFDTLSYNPLSAEIAVPAAAVAEALGQAFAGIDGPLYLLIDDFQHAGSALVQDVMALLLERLPAQVHMLVATRRHPDFSLSRLKLDDRLLQVDAHDLRLDAAQVQQLAAQLQLALDAAQVERLLQLTEGWVAGVKIALLALARTGPQALAAFSGRQPEVVDYFAHVVLRDLSPALRDFVLCTAAFEKFDAALCDAVLGRRDSARVLDIIAGQALFLQETEGQPGWYRYHPLFRDFLAARLHIEIPERISTLHAAAADCLLARGKTEMALTHARASSDAHFQRMLCECCARWLREGDYAAIVHWTGTLPDETVLAESDLCLPLIGALILSRRFNQARYYLDAVKDREPSPDSRFADDSTPTFLEVMLQLFQHDTDFRLHADHAVLLASCRHHDIRAFGLAIIAYHHLLHADFPQALQYATQAKAVLGQLGYEYLESYADLILILCDRNTGNVPPAIQRAETCMERFRENRNSPAWINATIAVAVVRYEQNRLDAALHMCEELMPRVSTACATEVIVATYLTLSRLLAQRNEQVRAARLTSQLQRILQLGNYDRFMGQLACEELLQAMLRRQPGAIERIAVTHRLPERLAAQTWQDQRTYEEGWERYGLATALWLRSTGRLAEAEALLGTLSASARQCGASARALVLDANLVVMRHLREDFAGAVALLQRLIDEHGLLCLNRIVYDEAPGLADVVRQAHLSHQIALPDVYLAVFRDVLVPEPVAETVPAPAPLTGKELEILELLQQGLSNSDISRETRIALSTTKWHLKNIFAKLGVANRTAAILRAAQLHSEKPLH